MNRLSDENLRARRQLKLSRFVVYLILIFLSVPVSYTHLRAHET